MDENARCDGRGDGDGGKGADDGDERWRAMASVTDSCNQREKNKRKHTVGTASAKWTAVAS